MSFVHKYERASSYGSKKRRAMFRYRKGVGTAVGTILIIAIFTAFFAVYLYMANNNIQSRTRLNFESLELVKLKSTFFLFNKSIGTTWFISTVQSVFITADESVGCGKGDARLDEGYWLQLKPSSQRSLPTTIINGENRIPTEASGNKYNQQGFNPQACYPRKQHVKDYIENALNERGFMNLKTLNPEDAGGVSLAITRGSSFYLDIEKNDRVELTFRQNIKAVYGSGTIDKETENNNTVQTSLKQMAAAGRNVVDALLDVGDRMDGSSGSLFAYKPAGATASKNVYEEAFRTGLYNAYIFTPSAAVLPANSIEPAQVAIELKANDASTQGVVTIPGSGLIVHYTATITYSEPEKYYYHDEGQNKFLKKPIKLTFKAEDYLPAIDCKTYNTDPYVATFNWEGSNDLICCASYLFSCGSTVDGLPSGQKINVGDRIKNTADGGSTEQEICNGVLSGQTFECTPAGFALT